MSTDTSARFTLGALEFERPVVMGILNVTPDSFSDGGRFDEPARALAAAAAMVEAGAGIVDIGGESTRPGAPAVDEAAEIDRVVPVVEMVSAQLDVAVSVDTSKPGVMRAAVAAGAAMINDVRALAEPAALDAAAGLGVPVCLMHMQGEPRTMQEDPRYADVVGEVLAFLEDRVAACEAAGIPRASIVLDPGFGFGKTVEHNVALLRNLRQFTVLGMPVLAGLSRKSTLGALTGRPVDERVAASVAAAAIAVVNGASIVRVHDVAASVDAVRVAGAVAEGSGRRP